MISHALTRPIARTSEAVLCHMDSLPIEILDLICKYVRFHLTKTYDAHSNLLFQTGDISETSLRCLALVNNGFYYAALPRIYECAAIKFYDYATLESAVNWITATPRWKHYKLYLKQLDILTIPETWGRLTLYDTGVVPSVTPKIKDIVGMSEFIPDAANSNLTEKFLSQWRSPSLDETKPEPFHYKEKNWQPLLELLSTLNRVEVLNYAVGNTFPRCLLQALHQYHPTCQLNIWSDQNIALDRPGLGSVELSRLPQYLDLFEIDLIRSPCLHAIKVLYPRGYVREFGMTVSQDAIISLLMKAPNLRHLQVKSISGGSSIIRSNEEWERFLASFEQPTTSTRLLTFCCNDGAFGNERIVAKWEEYFDFANLRALDIGRIKSVPDVAKLFSRLPTLEKLFINLADPLKLGVEQPIHFQEADFRSIFSSLKPLKHLCISGLCDKSAFGAILEYHGKSLRVLILEPDRSSYHEEHRHYHSYPSLVAEDILTIAKEAPGIRDLRLTIERSRGNHDERLFYEALGMFPSLQNLTLDLHYKPRPSNLGHGATLKDGASWSKHRARLETAFINAAMDETLAKEIWNVIYSKQQQEKLQSLRVVPIGWDLFFHRAERNIAFHLSRPFLLWKSGPEFGLKVVELGHDERELQVERESISAYEPDMTRSPPKRLQRLIRSLWGFSESQMEDWRLHWKSFPLDP